MKKRYLILIFLFVFIFLNIVYVKADTGIIPYSLNVNKEIFYPNETIEIDGSWQLYYDPPEVSYTQFRIYNNTEFEDVHLVWKSDKFTDTGEVFKSGNISVSSLSGINTSFEGSLNLYLTLYYYFEDTLDWMSLFFFNESFKIISQASFELINFDINKELFHPNEALCINSSWNLVYNDPEISYTQFHLFNDTDFNNKSLIWQSYIFDKKGFNSQLVNISLNTFFNNSFDRSINIYVSLLYFYDDYRSSPPLEQYIVNKTILIIRKAEIIDYNVSLNNEYFYPNSTIEINGSWYLEYNDPEICYTQFRIFIGPEFNNQSLIWKSKPFFDKFNVSKSINLPLLNIINLSSEGSKRLYITLYYYYDDISSVPPLELYLYCKSVLVLKKANVQLRNLSLSNELYYFDEILKFNASWSLRYEFPEICFLQFRIYNDTIFDDETLIWTSEQFSIKGNISKYLSIPIENIVNICEGKSIDLYISLVFYYDDYSSFPPAIQFVSNKTILIRSKEELTHNNPNMVLNLIIPSGISVLLFGAVLVFYFNKREKDKKVEDIVIKF